MKRLPKIALMCLLLSGCKEEECEDLAPSLEYQEFIRTAPGDDEARLVLKFTDCQGDVGLRENEGDHNMFITQFEFIDGEWVEFEPIDSTILFARIPYSDKIRDNEKLEGEIEKVLTNYRQNSDSIRFEIFIEDRAGHQSNMVETPLIVVDPS